MYRRCLGLLTLTTLLAGCASGPQGGGQDPHQTCRVELETARANHHGEVAELKNALQIVRDEFDLLEREVARSQRELEAARESTAQQKLAFETAMELVREKDGQLVALREQLAAQEDVPTPPEGELAGAMALLRQKDDQIEALRDELAFLKGGGQREVPQAVQGGVKIADLDLEQPVAFVDGRPLSRRGFMQFLYRDLAAPNLLELYINRQLILDESQRRGLDVSDLDAEVWVEHQLVSQVQAAGSNEAFAERLTESGYTREAWMSRLRYQARPAVLLTRIVAQDRTTPEGRAAWEGRLRQAYEQDYGELASASHILFRVDADAPDELVRDALTKAQRASKQLESGLAFPEAARRYSEDRDTARMGGYIGEFGRQRFADLPQLNAAFFTAPVGQPTRPVRSSVGFHIVLVEKRNPSPVSFAEARPKLEQRLRDEQPSDAEMEALLTRLRSKAAIQRTLKFTDDDE